MIWLIAMVVLIGALYLSALVPNEKIRGYLEESATELIPVASVNPVMEGVYHSIRDNYADVVLRNVIWDVDSKNPFSTMINTRYYDGEEKGECYGLLAAATGTSLTLVNCWYLITFMIMNVLCLFYIRYYKDIRMLLVRAVVGGTVPAFADYKQKLRSYRRKRR